MRFRKNEHRDARAMTGISQDSNFVHNQEDMPTNRRELHRLALILTANSCMFVFGVVVLLMGSLLPTLKVTYLQAGSLGTLVAAGIVAATTLVGPALDTIGAKPVMVAGLALVAGGLGLMPSLHSYASLATAALAYGFGGGVLNTATNVLVADLNVSGRGAALNMLGFSWCLGAVGVPLLMGTVGGSLGTAAVLHLLAASIGLIVIPALVFKFPPPSYVGMRLPDLIRVLNNPLVWLIAALLFFESGSEGSVFVWGGKIVVGVFKVPPQHANWAMVGLTAAMGTARLLTAFLLRRLGGRKTMVLAAVITIGGAIITYASWTFWAAILGMAIIGVGLAPIFQTALGVAGDHFPRNTGTVFGAIMAVALVGGAVTPALGGTLARVGLLNVLWIPVICAMAVALLALIVTRGSWDYGHFGLTSPIKDSGSSLTGK